MEGNECYKFKTVKYYIEKTRQEDIRIIVDVGANVGDMSLMMHAYFPEGKIFGFEPVKDYYEIAKARTVGICNIRLFQKALTSQHLFEDDLGQKPRPRATLMRILRALPESGPGWIGGSFVLPGDHELIQRHEIVPGYEKMDGEIIPTTILEFMESEDIEQIDLMKMDCEGCEHSALGCEEVDVLRRIRFITGEYHDIRKFYRVMQNKLFHTHKVNLIGGRNLGCFFAERLDGSRDGILKYDKSGMLIMRPWLCDSAIDWHIFNSEFVPEV